MGLTEITRNSEPRTVKTTVSSRPASVRPNANLSGFLLERCRGHDDRPIQKHLLGLRLADLVTRPVLADCHRPTETPRHQAGTQGRKPTITVYACHIHNAMGPSDLGEPLRSGLTWQMSRAPRPHDPTDGRPRRLHLVLAGCDFSTPLRCKACSTPATMGSGRRCRGSKPSTTTLAHVPTCQPGDDCAKLVMELVLGAWCLHLASAAPRAPYPCAPICRDCG